MQVLLVCLDFSVLSFVRSCKCCLFGCSDVSVRSFLVVSSVQLAHQLEVLQVLPCKLLIGSRCSFIHNGVLVCRMEIRHKSVAMWDRLFSTCTGMHLKAALAGRVAAEQYPGMPSDVPSDICDDVQLLENELEKSTTRSNIHNVAVDVALSALQGISATEPRELVDSWK